MHIRHAYIIVMLFIALAGGPLFYLDYARELHKYETRITACASLNSESVEQVELSRRVMGFCGMEYLSRPTKSRRTSKWADWGGAFAILALLPTVSGFIGYPDYQVDGRFRDCAQ